MCVLTALGVMAVMIWFFTEAWIFAVHDKAIWLIALLTVTTATIAFSHGYFIWLAVTHRQQMYMIFFPSYSVPKPRGVTPKNREMFASFPYDPMACLGRRHESNGQPTVGWEQTTFTDVSLLAPSTMREAFCPPGHNLLDETVKYETDMDETPTIPLDPSRSRTWSRSDVGSAVSSKPESSVDLDGYGSDGSRINSSEDFNIEGGGGRRARTLPYLSNETSDGKVVWWGGGRRGGHPEPGAYTFRNDSNSCSSSNSSSSSSGSGGGSNSGDSDNSDSSGSNSDSDGSRGGREGHLGCLRFDPSNNSTVGAIECGWDTTDLRTPSKVGAAEGAHNGDGRNKAAEAPSSWWRDPQHYLRGEGEQWKVEQGGGKGSLVLDRVWPGPFTESSKAVRRGGGVVRRVEDGYTVEEATVPPGRDIESGTMGCSDEQDLSGGGGGLGLGPRLKLEEEEGEGEGLEEIVRVGELPDLCSICLGEYKKDERVHVLPCLHIFHQECLDTWIEGHDSCPFCKRCLNHHPPALTKHQRTRRVLEALLMVPLLPPREFWTHRVEPSATYPS